MGAGNHKVCLSPFDYCKHSSSRSLIYMWNILLEISSQWQELHNCSTRVQRLRPDTQIFKEGIWTSSCSCVNSMKMPTDFKNVVKGAEKHILWGGEGKYMKEQEGSWTRKPGKQMLCRSKVKIAFRSGGRCSGQVIHCRASSAEGRQPVFSTTIILKSTTSSLHCD